MSVLSETPQAIVLYVWVTIKRIDKPQQEVAHLS